ncbi:MAG: hypothetical protein U1G07_24065 [Verrucomicrobiota bacterium]
MKVELPAQPVQGCDAGADQILLKRFAHVPVQVEDRAIGGRFLSGQLPQFRGEEGVNGDYGILLVLGRGTARQDKRPLFLEVHVRPEQLAKLA